VLTAFYMTRLVAETFLGSARSDSAAHAHESPAVMTVPLLLLAAGAVGLGFLGTPAFPWLQARLLGETAVHGHSLLEGGGLMMLSIVLVALGLGAGWALFARIPRTKPGAPDPVQSAFPGLFAALAARLGFDELYAATIGRLNTFAAALADGLDRHVWDGFIRFLARLGEFAGVVNRETDEEVLNGGFDAGGAALRGTGRTYARAQTGEAHGYLRILAIGFVLLVLGVMFGGGV
jgi:NADH-quinone oxidoreductase subunit L